MNTGPFLRYRERRRAQAGVKAGALLASLAVLIALVVPGRGEGQERGASRSHAKVDINTASAEELQRLPGMTPSLSRRIAANRPYRKIDDLVRRRVLGRKQVAGIKEFVTVGPPAGEPAPTSSR